MKLASRLGAPIAAAAITLTAFVGAAPAHADAAYCQYKVVNAPNGLFIRSAPSSSAPTIDKVPNGTTGLASQTITNGFRNFHGGWAGAAYLSRVVGPLCAV